MSVFVVQLLSWVWLFASPWTAARQAPLSFTISQSLLKFISIELVLSNHLIPYCPLLSSVFPSIKFFSRESALCIKWPKYWSFRFSISSSNEYSGLISLGLTDLISLLQGTLTSLNTLIQKHELFGAQPSFQSNSHIFTWLLEKPQLWLSRPLLAKWCLCLLIHCLIIVIGTT